jgi:hypothetical protein
MMFPEGTAFLYLEPASTSAKRSAGSSFVRTAYFLRDFDKSKES